MKIVFPVPRMGRAEVETRPFVKLITSFLIVLGLGLTGLVMISQKYLDKNHVVEVSADADENAAAGRNPAQGIITGFRIATGSNGEETTAENSDRPRRVVRSRPTPKFPRTQKVLDLLEGLLVTHQYTPYFIIYNREVEMLKQALHDLAASSERKFLSDHLLRYIDEASYAHTKLREAWRIKTNPLKTADDVSEYLRSVRVSVTKRKNGFRSLPTGSKKTAYERAAENLISDARDFTEKARCEYRRISRDSRTTMQATEAQLPDGATRGN